MQSERDMTSIVGMFMLYIWNVHILIISAFEEMYILFWWLGSKFWSVQI